MLITESTKIKDYVSNVDDTLKFKNFKSHAMEAEIWLRNIVGKDLIKVANALVKTPDPTNEAGNELLDRCITAICFWAVISYHKVANVTTSNAGTFRIEKQDQQTAYKYQLYEANEKYRSMAFMYVDELLQWLNDTSTDTVLPEWKNSNEKKKYDACWITPTDLEELQGIDNASYFLHVIRHLVLQVQKRDIADRMPADKYAEIVSQKTAGTLTPENQAIIESAKPSIIQGALMLTVRFLSLELLPTGLFKNWFSDTANTKETTQLKEREALESRYLESFHAELIDFESYLVSLWPPTETVTSTDTRCQEEIWSESKFVNLG